MTRLADLLHEDAARQTSDGLGDEALRHPTSADRPFRAAMVWSALKLKAETPTPPSRRWPLNTRHGNGQLRLTYRFTDWRLQCSFTTWFNENQAPWTKYSKP
jgi:hypothetical protein